jgi:exosortase
VTQRLIRFLLWCAGVLGIFAVPLSHLVRQSLGEGYSSHIILIPVLTVYLVWSRKQTIFASISYCFVRGMQVAAVGVLMAVVAFGLKLTTVGSSYVPLFTVASVLLLLLGGFVGFFGIRALRQASFPIALLLLVVPIPDFLMDNVIGFLQSGSAELSAWIFSMLGIPVLRDGFVLTVPGISIEVARECSGINSSIALLIIMLLVAHETLHSTWRRALLVLITIPLSIVKNAIRIVTLTILATRVDPGFLTGRLHHQGGFVFYLISLCLVYPIWKILQKTETPHNLPAAQGAVSS